MLGLGLGLTKTGYLPRGKSLPTGYVQLHGRDASRSRNTLTGRLPGAGVVALLAKVA